jgi:hypothetical protein
MDAALTKTGASASNVTVTTETVTVITWSAPGASSFTVSMNIPPPAWNHDMPGISSLECKVIRTNPAQPGAVFSATTVGPTEGGASGVLSSQPLTGTLNANGEAQLQVRINRLGTYVNTVTVISGASQVTVVQNVTVTAAPNTCPLVSSSIRFKRDVMALLPDDARPLGLRPVAFRYLEPWGDPSAARIGLIAEDVAEVFPEAVFLDAEGRPESIDYGILTGAVMEEVAGRTGGIARAAIARLAEVF